jgi:hypothetical protein
VALKANTLSALTGTRIFSKNLKSSFTEENKVEMSFGRRKFPSTQSHGNITNLKCLNLLRQTNKLSLNLLNLQGFTALLGLRLHSMEWFQTGKC